jgi:thermitase
MKSKAWLLASALMVLIFGSTVFAAPTFQPNPDVSKHVPGEILVGFRADAAVDQTDAAVKAVGGVVLGKISFPQTKVHRVKLASTSQEALDQAITNLKANPLVKYAEPHARRFAHRTGRPGGATIQAQSGDPLLWDQWGYYDIGANWVSPPSGTTSPLVAVIDTGVDYTHPDLAGKVVKGYDFVNDDADPMDDYGHGTHVSGVIAAIANNAYGMAGIAWKAKILAIKALSSQGWGTDYEIALAIRYAANNTSVKVINMSLGGEGYSQAEYDAVEYAVVTKKKLLVASAGNDYGMAIPYPGGFADPVEFPEFIGRVLAVAAHDITQCKADFSNFGPWVSITAPGVNILSTVPPSLGYAGFDWWDGTSMAAPHVAGAAAATWERYPTYNNVQVANLITQNNAASPYGWLNRDNTCWPADGSTFDRLDLMHMFEESYFEDPLTTTRGFIYGFAFNAENGEPLAGAKVTAKKGTVVKGTDYVTYFGERTYFYPDSVARQGYGLFSVLTEAGTNSVTFQKTGFASPAFAELDVLPDLEYYVGDIPVPPKKGKYWLAVTWDNYYGGAVYDSFLFVPGYGYIDPYSNPGALKDWPYAKVLWDSDDPYDYMVGNRRAFSEVIRIKQTVAGEYTLSVWDWGNGLGSTSWSESGIKVYIYRWDAATLTPKLVETFTPPPVGAGQYWDVCTISGNTITQIGTISD